MNKILDFSTTNEILFIAIIAIFALILFLRKPEFRKQAKFLGTLYTTLAIWAIFVAALMILIITNTWDLPNSKPTSNEIRDALTICICMGVLGGIVSWIGTLTTKPNTTPNEPTEALNRRKKKWLLQTLLGPLQSGALALIIAICLYGGINILSLDTTGSGTSSTVNWIAVYGISGLVGLFTPQVLERLEIQVLSYFNSKEPDEDSDSMPRTDNSEQTEGDSSTSKD